MPVNFNDFMRRLGCRNQSELAEKLGIAQSSLSAWGSGFRSPRYEDCKRLLQMGMSVEELFGDDLSGLETLVKPGKKVADSKLEAFLSGLEDLIKNLKET